jgi:hypothetical protein
MESARVRASATQWASPAESREASRTPWLSASGLGWVLQTALEMALAMSPPAIVWG